MQLWKNLFGWLRLNDQDNEKTQNPYLDPPDLEKLKKSLKVVSQAKHQGAKGYPPPDASRLSDVEANITTELEAERHKVLSWAERQLGAIHKRLNELDITKSVNRSSVVDEEFERRADNLLSDQEPLLKGLEARSLQFESELKAFRDDNQLTRHAVVPTGARKFLMSMVIAGILLLEGVFNAKFFAESMDGGLIDGFLTAIAFAVLNVAFCFAMGRVGLPQTIHVKGYRKCIGVLSIFITLSGMLVIGLFTAHFRDALAQGVDGSTNDAAKLALAAFKQSPFVLADVVSYVLWAVTLFFGLVALIDGLVWNDIYPGYGKVQKRRDQAVAAYEEEIQDVREQLEELKTELLTDLDENVHKAQRNVVTFQAQIEDKMGMRVKWVALLDNSEKIMNALIQCYRTENTMSREGRQRPAYFDKDIVLTPIRLPENDPSEDRIRLREQQAQLAGLLAKLESIRARVQASFNNKFNQLEPIQVQLRK